MDTVLLIWGAMADAPLKCWGYLALALITIYAIWVVSGLQAKMTHQWQYTLDGDFVMEHEMFKGMAWQGDWGSIENGKLLIKNGYSWDGCTPKYHLLGLTVWGTPDGILRHGKPWTYWASLVHDFLCQFGQERDNGFPMNAKQTHRLFKEMLDDVDWPLAGIYYRVVRLFGPKRLGPDFK